MNNGRLFHWLDRSLRLVGHRHAADAGGAVRDIAIKETIVVHRQGVDRELAQMIEIRRWLRAPR